MGIKYPHKSIKLFSDFKCGLRTVHLGLLRLVMWCFQPALKETIPLYGKPFLWKINGLCKSGVKKWGMSCVAEEEGVAVEATVICTGQTGVEMEALTAVSTALLTVYDMCKAVDKTMLIGGIVLVEKNKEDV